MEGAPIIATPANPSGPRRSALTLALCTLLHAFTHAYQSLLVPLYLLMVGSLHLPGVGAVASIVTAYTAVYFLLSYPAGILTDRLNRKMLLGVGLLGNAVVISLFAATHQYWVLLALGIAAGAFGALFHPSANALLSAHYPRSPGMALGLLGIGSGVGFYFGSQYPGWRVQSGHAFWGLANWQLPCIEMGLVGVAVAVLFLFMAREVEHGHARRARVPMGARLRWRMLAIAAVIGWRDFAGSATTSLLSIYLQKAHAYSPKDTGWILGAMGLLSIIATPVAVFASPGRRRLPALAIVIMAGGATLIAVPHVPMAWLLAVLGVFQVFLLSSFAIGEVSLVERVDGAVRGRVIGLFLTICGTMGAAAPSVVGWWTDRMGHCAFVQSGYMVPFAVLGVMMIFGSLAVRLIHSLGDVHPLPSREALQIAESEPSV
jgi:MFS family permease